MFTLGLVYCTGWKEDGIDLAGWVMPERTSRHSLNSTSGQLALSWTPFKIPLPFYSYHLGPVLSTDFCTGESSPTGKTYWDVAYALSVHRFTTPYILLPHPLWEAMLWHFLTFYMTSLDWVWYFMVLSFFFKTCKQIIFFFKSSTCGVLLSNSFSNNFKYK